MSPYDAGDMATHLDDIFRMRPRTNPLPHAIVVYSKGIAERSLVQIVITYLASLTVEDLKRIVENFWAIPAGMIALYFYGVFHFNTPDYRLAFLQNSETPALITLAPPKFTTTRTRFRRYARRYVLILETVFLSFIFFTSIYSDAAKLLNVNVSELHFDTATLQFKVLIALFFLTGLLSSFPGFKDIDSWLLRKLHQAALIPDDAKLMATRLFNEEFRPSLATRAQVLQSLRSRDTLRFANGKITGSLEKRVVSLLWLNNEIKQKTNEAGCEYFTAKFEIDLTDVAKNFAKMTAELQTYFREQAKLVPENAPDIDQFFSDNMDKEGVAPLVQRRNELLLEYDNLYYRVCLLTSLLAYSIEASPERIGSLLSKLGFAVKITANPIMDWDAVFRVVLSVFVLTISANIIFVTISTSYFQASLVPDRSIVLRFAGAATLLHFIVIYAVLKIKRHRRHLTVTSNPRGAENPAIAVLSYLLTLPISVALSYSIRHELSTAPFLFAINQGIVGYFIATYVDRSLADQTLSWRAAFAQGACQAASTIIIVYFLPEIPGQPPQSAIQQFIFGAIFVCQAGLSGFFVGTVFQYFYRRTKSPDGQVVGDITVQTVHAAE